MKTILRTLAACGVLAAGPLRAQDDGDTNAIDDIPHVTIIGLATTEAVPDLATIAVGVVIEKPSARQASEENATATQAIVAAAKGAGVASPDIATQSVMLTQTFDDVQDGSGHYGRKPRGFEATNMLSIRVRDLAKAGTIAQDLIDKGANRFNGISFSIEHPEPILDRLTAEAVKNARRQAQLAADAAGVRLGRVLLIERPGAPGPSPGFAVARMAAAKAIPVEAGVQSLTREIEVTWALDGS